MESHNLINSTTPNTNDPPDTQEGEISLKEITTCPDEESKLYFYDKFGNKLWIYSEDVLQYAIANNITVEVEVEEE